jgi:hypothetical protein
MIGVEDLDPAQQTRRPRAANDQPTSKAIAELSLQRGRDRKARLARTEHDHRPGSIEVEGPSADTQILTVDLNHSVNRVSRVGGTQTRSDDLESDLPQIRRAVVEQPVAVADRRQIWRACPDVALGDLRSVDCHEERLTLIAGKCAPG